VAERVVIEGTLPTGFRLELEATVTESHRRQAEVTKHPVETGANLTDHVLVGPQEIDIIGVVSNTPIKQRETDPDLPSVPGGDPLRRAESAFEALGNVQNTGTLCRITTTLVTYSNMFLAVLNVVRDAQKANVAELQMTWTEVRFAETLVVALPLAKKKLGKQGTKDATDKQKQQAESVARQTAGRAVRAAFDIFQ